MHPMVVHESSAGTAKSMWKDEPADKPKPMAIEQFVPFVSDYKFFEDMGVRVFANGHSFSGVHFSIHSEYSAVPGYEAAMNAAYGEERSAADPRPGAPQHRLLPEPDDQGRDPVDPRRPADRRRQDAGRELDLPPEGRARRAAAAHRRCTTGSSTRRSRSSATTTCTRYRGDPEGPARERQRRGSACTATSTRPRSARPTVTAHGTSEISIRNQYRAWVALHDATMRRARPRATSAADSSERELVDFVVPRGAPARRAATTSGTRSAPTTRIYWVPLDARPARRPRTTPRTSTRTGCCASCASSG